MGFSGLKICTVPNGTHFFGVRLIPCDCACLLAIEGANRLKPGKKEYIKTGFGAQYVFNSHKSNNLAESPTSLSGSCQSCGPDIAFEETKHDSDRNSLPFVLCQVAKHIWRAHAAALSYYYIYQSYSEQGRQNLGEGG